MTTLLHCLLMLFLISNICAQEIISNPQTAIYSVLSDFDADVYNTCDGAINFVDQSAGNPSNWLWLFGDGGISTQQNPSYTYQNSGTYDVSLITFNNSGTDTLTKIAFINVEKPNIISIQNADACLNGSATLSVSNGNGTVNWYDGSNTLIHTGNTFTTPALNSTTSYFVEDVLFNTETLYAGPQDGNSVGGGGYHGGGFTGGVNFTAYKAFEIASVWVDADGSGPRTINFWDGHVLSGQGTINNTLLDSRTVNIPTGQSRALVNFIVPGPGDYCIGGNQMDLFRNNGSAVYPYSLNGVLDMVSATTSSNGFFYYFYDWELLFKEECKSPKETLTARVIEADFSFSISGDTVQFTDLSTMAESWFWDFGDGNSSTQQNPTHVFSSSLGNVTLTINDQCSASKNLNNVAVTEYFDSDLIAIFPNPVNALLTLQAQTDPIKDCVVRIYSSAGKLVSSSSFGILDQVQISTETLSNGLYIIQIQYDERLSSHKFQVHH